MLRTDTDGYKMYACVNYASTKDNASPFHQKLSIEVFPHEKKTPIRDFSYKRQPHIVILEKN